MLKSGETSKANRRVPRRTWVTSGVGIGLITALLLANRGWKVYQARQQAAKAAALALEKKHQFGDQLVELDRRETAQFWNCVMAKEVNLGTFFKSHQFEEGLEAAFSTQPKTFATYLTTECQPKLERVLAALNGLGETPPELVGALGQYRASLSKLQSGLSNYAVGLEKREGSPEAVDDLNQLIQELGMAWHTVPQITAETAAFERFLNCAIPDLSSLENAQKLVELLVEQCVRKDAVRFMDRVRAECGALLAVPDKTAKIDPKSVPTWERSHQRFLEAEKRLLQAFESCGKRWRKAQKSDGKEQFMYAIAAHMDARAAIGRAFRSLAPRPPKDPR
jgi:hypothetical protein